MNNKLWLLRLIITPIALFYVLLPLTVIWYPESFAVAISIVLFVLLLIYLLLRNHIICKVFEIIRADRDFNDDTLKLNAFYSNRYALIDFFCFFVGVMIAFFSKNASCKSIWPFIPILLSIHFFIENYKALNYYKKYMEKRK